MVRYEPPSLASRCSGCCGRLATNCFPFYNGLRRPFKPKILRLVLALLYCAFGFVWMVLCGKLAAYRATKVRRYSIFMNYAYIMWLFILLFISQDVASLPDVLFDVLPERKLYPLPDVLIYTLLTSVLGRVVSFLLIICDKNVVSLLQDISFQWCGYCQKICNYLWMCIYSSWILIVVHFLTQPSKQLPSVHS